MAKLEFEHEKPELAALELENAERQDSVTTEEQETFSWNFNVLSSIFALSSVVLAASWVTLVPTSAIPFIAARFPEDAHNAGWIATSSLITIAVVESFIGDLSDIFGRRSFLLFGSVMGMIGSIIGGRASSLTMVIGGQVLNAVGVGCGSLAAPLIQEIVPNSHRPLVMASVALLGSFTFVGSPILEGVFISKGYGGELDGWRIGFYVGAGLYLYQIACLVAFYHPMDRPNPHDLSKMQRVRKLDWTGIFLVTATLTLFLAGINSGGNPHPWSSGIVLGTILSGILCLGLFVAWEWIGTSDGILPHALWEDPNYRTTLIIRVVGGFALLGSQAFIPQLLVEVFNTSGIMTAVWQLPFSVSTIVGICFAAILLQKFKEVKWITVGILTILTLGAGLMMLIKPDSSFVVVFFPTALMGIAVGSESTLLGIMSGLSVTPKYIATAICIGNAATFVGGAVAATMYSQIYGSRIKKKLPKALTQAALKAGVPMSSITEFLVAYSSANTTALAAIPGFSPKLLESVSTAAKYAYADSFKYIWIVLICFCALSIAISFMYTSTKKYMTDNVAAPVKDRKMNTAQSKA